MKEKDINAWLLRTLIFASILPLIVLSYYSVPNLEDYAESIIPNIWWHVKFLYLTYDGRFFTSFLFAAFNPLKYQSFLGYKLIPVSLLIGLYASLFVLIKTFILRSKSKALILSGLILVIYLHRIPHLAFSFYYMVSAYVYMVPSILFLFYISTSYRLINNNSSSLTLLIISTLLIFGVAGGNEFYLMPLMLWHIILFAFNSRNSRKKTTELVALTCSLACAYFIVFTSPGIGDFVEKNRTPLDFQHLITALQLSISFTLKYLFIWLKNNYTLLAFSFFLLIYFKRTLPKDWISWSPKLSTAIFISGFGLGLFLLLPYTLFGNEKINPDYIQIYLIPILYFILLWVFYLALIAKHLPEFKLPPYLATFLLLAGTAGIYLDKHSQLLTAYKEWQDDTAQNYYREVLEQVNAAKNTTGVLEVCVLKYQPKTIYSGVYFQLENRNFHLAYRKYYDLQDIQVKKCH
jgi:hypothetical protein